MKHAQQRMIEHIRQDIAGRFSSVPREQLRLAAAGTFLAEKQAQAWVDMIRAAFPGEEVIYNPLSLSIGCHTGPNAAGIAVIKLCD